jgi:hypothetical protein
LLLLLLLSGTTAAAAATDLSDGVAAAVNHNSSLTENIRASYPIHFIRNARIPCRGSHPRNVILLCCDAFGVLPPVSRLSLEQALYHFVSGYTAKLAGDDQVGGTCQPSVMLQTCCKACRIAMCNVTKDKASNTSEHRHPRQEQPAATSQAM